MKRIAISDDVSGRARLKLLCKDLDQVVQDRPSTWGRIHIRFFRKRHLIKIIYLMALQMEELKDGK